MNGLKTRHQAVQKVLWLVLILNWAVAAAKIIYGLWSRSTSMTSDGFHSLSDGTSNIIGLIGMRFCSQPQDEDHPYGHRKYETLFALGIAAMLIMVAFNLARGGISRIFNPVAPQVGIYSFVVMAATLAVNVAVMAYEYRSGKRLQSDILVVDSMHTRADIFTSLSVIAALIGVKLGFPIIDPIATLVIAVFIAYSAFDIIRAEAGVLCDAVAIVDTDRIKTVVMGIDNVKNCHKIRTRGRPDDIHLDLHVQVNGQTTLYDSHQISHLIQTEVTKQFPHIVDVIVHMEPVLAGKDS